MKLNLINPPSSTKKISAKGFTNSTPDKFINQFFRCKDDPRLSPGNVHRVRQEWYEDYSNRSYGQTLDELFYPTLRPLEISTDLGDFICHSDRHKSQVPLVLGLNGLWSITVNYESDGNYCDFTIQVDCGGIFRFGADSIEKDLKERYGSLIYQQWRALVMSDLDSLKELIQEVRNNIAVVVPSITCGKRSTRLCQRVGIPVVKNFAFLFPSSYTI